MSAIVLSTHSTDESNITLTKNLTDYCKNALHLVSAFFVHLHRGRVGNEDVGLDAVHIAFVEHIVYGLH